MSTVRQLKALRNCTRGLVLRAVDLIADHIQRMHVPVKHFIRTSSGSCRDDKFETSAQIAAFSFIILESTNSTGTLSRNMHCDKRNSAKHKFFREKKISIMSVRNRRGWRSLLNLVLNLASTITCWKFRPIINLEIHFKYGPKSNGPGMVAVNQLLGNQTNIDYVSRLSISRLIARPLG